jgi:hypothetical protein
VKKKLIEMYGLSEGPFDDVQNKLNRSQSVIGGPRTEPSVRKHQDRAARHSTDTARAQSDIDSAQSIFQREALGDGETTPVDLTKKELQMIAGWAAFAGATESPQAKSLLDKIESAMGTSSSMGMRVKRTPFGGM